MLCIRSKFTRLGNELSDTRLNFEQFTEEITLAVTVTGEILGYITEKCGTDIQTHRNRLSEMTRDCSIYNSRMVKLHSGLNDLFTLWQVESDAFARKETQDEELNIAFDALVEKYIEWYGRYTDFKTSLKSVKKKWYGYENEILASVN